MVYGSSREAALNWRKSSASVDDSQCVEVATFGPSVLVRDSRDHSAGVIVLGRAQWNAFMDALRDGAVDLR
ncbi:DUF397 domain-containing protein [Actinomadura geliboluensis]|uniref:DUF397 domain-containing protein n=1 Tax=Actinomadura geliboluensis TaxID=882440 RepID=A0A5S4GX31_9ACTN|nr:DUF397 domain-containing protein [Actinomadura geliboluensis]TMR37553.1 DUF397 domain-containing protein [Actinomadura geliboluensis]